MPDRFLLNRGAAFRPVMEYLRTAVAGFSKSGRTLMLCAGSGLFLLPPQAMAIEALPPTGLAAVSLSVTQEAGSREFEESLKALREGDAYDRHRAAIALGRSGKTEAVGPLINALGDEDLFVRSFAAAALGNLGDRKAVPPLIKTLGDESLIVRCSAAAALGILKDPGAVDSLTKALKDENYLVRRAAAEALGSLGDARAVDPLLESLGDEDSYIWNGAAVALTHIGGAAIPKLVNSLGDWVSGPRIAGILKSLNWQPSSDEERIRFDVATRNSKALLQNWETARKVLVSDANHGSEGQVNNAVFALIGLGRDEILDELARILRAKGSIQIAAAYLESGNDPLSKIAAKWAKEQGSEIKPGSTTRSVKWGRMDSF